MTNYDKGNRPGLGMIVLDAAILAVMAGVLAWMVATLPDRPDRWDWIGVAVYTVLTVLYTITIVGQVIRRRAMPEGIQPLIWCRGCEGTGAVLDGMCWDCQGAGAIPRRIR